MAKSGKLFAGIGAVLLGAAAANSLPAELTRSPSDLYGPRTAASSAAAVLPAAERRSSSTADTFRYWNQIAIDASGVDHTPVAAGETRVFGEQLGPGRAARAMAIVHIAMFDAVNAITAATAATRDLRARVAPDVDRRRDRQRRA